MTYITALTIGPIYKTLQRAEQTRELWGASMMFSLLMKNIVTRFKKINIEPLVPYFDESIFNVLENDHISTGLLPDRLYFKSEENGLKMLRAITDAAIGDFCSMIYEQVAENNNEHLTNFMKSYIQCYSVSIIDQPEHGNTIKQLASQLDTLELQNLPMNDSNGFLEKYLNTIPNIKAFHRLFPDKKGFDTIPEIAMEEFFSLDEENYKNWINRIKKRDTQYNRYKLNEDLDIMEIAREVFGKKKRINNNGILIEEENVLTPHKYICIIYADGDNIGKLITSKSDEVVRKISEALFIFGKKAQGKINNYGGMPVYIGGDDLFFFAPFRNITKPEKHILSLCSELDKLFKETLGEINECKTEKVSLSFGLSTSYYKYPMGESIDISRDLLFQKAKSNAFTWKRKDQPNIKNNIAYQTRQHSGSTWEGIFQLDSERRTSTFDNVIKIMNAHLDNDDGSLLKSVIDKIRRNKPLVIELLRSPDETKADRIERFFENNFDETEHIAFRYFFKNVAEFMTNVYSISKTLSENNRVEEYWMETNNEHFKLEHHVISETISALRLIKFINQTDEHE